MSSFQLGIGAGFHGVVKVGNKYALVMDKVEGYNIKMWMMETLQKGFIISQKMIQEMRRQITVLYNAGFFTPDMESLTGPIKELSLDNILENLNDHLKVWHRQWRVEGTL